MSPIFGFIAEFNKKLDRDGARRGKEALGYNLFQMLGIERLEPKFHSKILADLLNPNGSHAQGSVFLHNFFQLLCNKGLLDASMAARKASGYTVERERSKIDISIYEKGVSYIAIENKIDAGEQCEQLSRYRKKIDDYPAAEYPIRELFYLTLDGKPSETAPADQYHCLSYKEDILGWLDACIHEALPPRILGTLLQYRETVTRLTDMTKFLESDEAAKFLAQPDKFRIALEVIKKIEDAKSLLQVRFWEAVKDRLQNDLKVHVELTLKADPSYGDAGIAVYLKPDDEKEHLALQLYQDGSYSRLWFSVSLWGERKQEEFESLKGKTEVAVLIQELEKQNQYAAIKKFERPHLAWFYRDTFLRVDDTAEKLSSDMALIVSDVCNDFEEFVRLCLPLIQRISL